MLSHFYRSAVDRYGANRVVIGGRSAGGNLAVATTLRARDEGVPPPAALVLLSPEVDLTESGDSFEVNRTVDVVLPNPLMSANLLYANGADLSHPYLSPLFGPFDARITDRLTRSPLDALLTESAVRSVIRFVGLRQFEVAQNSVDMNRLLDRLEFLQGITLEISILVGMLPDRIARLRRPRAPQVRAGRCSA